MWHRRPRPSIGVARAEVAVGGDDRRHAGGAAGLRRRAGRRRRRCSRAGASASRRAASSSGAGCGLACGVVSPHDHASRPRSQAQRRDQRRGEARRLVGDDAPRHAARRRAHRAPAACRRRRASSLRHARLVVREELVAQRDEVRHRPASCRTRRRACRARPTPTMGRSARAAAAAGRASTRISFAGAGEVGRAVDQRAVEVEQHRTRHRVDTSCRLAAGDQVVDAGVAGQPVAPRQRVVFHAARVDQSSPAARHQPASSLGRMNFA